MSDTTVHIFKPRISLRHMEVFLVGTGLAFITGPVILLFTGDIAAFALPTGFAVLMGLVLYSQVFAPGTIYRIDGDALLLKRPPVQKLLPITDIRSVRIMNGREVSDFLRDYQADEYRKIGGADITGAFRTRLRLGRLIRFCTAPIVFTSTTAGNPLNVTDFGVRTSGFFVMVEMRDGAAFLLSPAEPDSFAETLRSMIVS